MTLALGPTNTYVLYVANTGDGTISVFDPTTGQLLGQVTDAAANPLVIPGLRGIAAGNRYANQSALALFFAAGPATGTHGIYARLDAGLPPIFHAPGMISLSSAGSGLHGARFMAAVTGPTAVAHVDFYGPTGYVTWNQLSAPYYGFSTPPATATVVDMDGNVATSP